MGVMIECLDIRVGEAATVSLRDRIWPGARRPVIMTPVLRSDRWVCVKYSRAAGSRSWTLFLPKPQAAGTRKLMHMSRAPRPGVDRYEKATTPRVDLSRSAALCTLLGVLGCGDNDFMALAEPPAISLPTDGGGAD